MLLLTSLVLALGIWYVTKIYLIDRAERQEAEIKQASIDREKQEKYEQMKKSSEEYNQAMSSKNPESCQAITDKSTREDCEDAYTLQRAHSSPGDTEAICRQMHRAFRIESCISSIAYAKIQDQKKTTQAPDTISKLREERAKCDAITDKIYQSSCVSDTERTYVQSTHAR